LIKAIGLKNGIPVKQDLSRWNKRADFNNKKDTIQSQLVLAEALYDPTMENTVRRRGRALQ